eukprot:3481967-Rhodomonas_salina.2
MLGADCLGPHRADTSALPEVSAFWRQRHSLGRDRIATTMLNARLNAAGAMSTPNAHHMNCKRKEATRWRWGWARPMVEAEVAMKRTF